MRALAILFVTLLLVGCGSQPARAPAPKAEETPAPVEVSFAKDVQSIVTANCLPCHSGAKDAAAKSNWTTYDGVMADVVAGNPDSSKFYQMLRDGKMPPSGKLDSTKLATIQRWINEGAKNN